MQNVPQSRKYSTSHTNSAIARNMGPMNQFHCPWVVVFDHLWLAYDYRSEASGSQGLECWPVCMRGAVVGGVGWSPMFWKKKAGSPWQ